MCEQTVRGAENQRFTVKSILDIEFARLMQRTRRRYAVEHGASMNEYDLLVRVLVTSGRRVRAHLISENHRVCI